ncbi:MAG: helix-turn-helix transcriptional regulator [Desulfocapsa sp.]|jgi:excisionase family DNA binding protein|uniref:Helix-turn-helix transcriptional regulator n=1 Tax=Desulfotalea psychrophila TaxID=84980 RepID=A0ABS3AUM4_9BACT|nr:helix-turn-helix transcriptional regulator [Desulfocapsa sp.]MBN4048822.1 helix-turn-helix transcriptional regulator [bacterium AH-315-N22]MBN4068784.1 helix-turn-helix transcriptional regulator [Desulfotalea psychrophila]
MITGSHNKFLTTKNVAELLNVNEKMIYSLVNDKGLPATKVTGKWLFPHRLVEEWLEAHILNYTSNTCDFSSDNGLLLLAGSDDPLFQKTLSLFHAKIKDTVAFFANQGSMGGLTSMRRGLCHIGVCHLLQDDDSGYNFSIAEQELDKPPVFVNFSKREQGLLIQKGNPENIRSINDLARDDIRIVNRPLGTGTRLLLDYEIARSKIATEQIGGYDIEVSRHLDAGLEVLAGRADAAPGIRTVAGMLGIDFIPLRWERFDLLISRERFFEKGVQSFISLLHEEEFRKLAESFVGYDVSMCGKMLFPDNFITEE